MASLKQPPLQEPLFQLRDNALVCEDKEIFADVTTHATRGSATGGSHGHGFFLIIPANKLQLEDQCLDESTVSSY